MPDRVVKESIGTSDSLSKVSLTAALFWANFLTVMDDYGCFDARVPIIRSKMFPLRKDVTDEMIESWLQEFARDDVRMIRFWTEPNGVRYGQCVSFEFHNDLLSKKAPTTPCPPWMKSDAGLDPRLSTTTLQAYERIGVAIAKLSSDGKTPTYREIIKESGCSASTLAKYWKHKHATPCYTSLQDDTDATARIRIGNKNGNQNPKDIPPPAAPVAPTVVPDDRRVPLRDFMFDELRKIGIEPLTDARTWKAFEKMLTATRGKERFTIGELQAYFMRLINSPNPFHRSQADQIRFFCEHLSAFTRSDNATRQPSSNQTPPAGRPSRPYVPRQ